MNEARKLVDLLRSKQATNKSLGQHFLISDAMIALPIGHAKVHSDDHVLEIGPGPGVLTQQLLKTGCKSQQSRLMMASIITSWGFSNQR